MKTLKIILFYIASFTWGAVMSVIGAVACLALLITGHKPKLFHHVVYFEVGKNWGGVNLGVVFLCSKDCPESTHKHESGHGIQNVWFGPLMPFIVGIPSALRYWLREQKTQQAKVLFAVVVYSILVVISFLSIALHLINLWLLVIPILLYIYGTIIFLWLLWKEIPKYEEGKYVPYDSIWFEGQATALGDKYF